MSYTINLFNPVESKLTVKQATANVINRIVQADHDLFISVFISPIWSKKVPTQPFDWVGQIIDSYAENAAYAAVYADRTLLMGCNERVVKIVRSTGDWGKVIPDQGLMDRVLALEESLFTPEALLGVPSKMSAFLKYDHDQYAPAVHVDGSGICIWFEDYRRAIPSKCNFQPTLYRQGSIVGMEIGDYRTIVKGFFI